MNFTFLGFDKPFQEQWKHEENKVDNKCTLTLAPDIVIPIQDFREDLISKFSGAPEKIHYYNCLVPFYQLYYGRPVGREIDPVVICHLQSGRWELTTVKYLNQVCLNQILQLSLFTQHTLFQHHMLKLEKQTLKHQAMFEQIAERSDVFREFVKECEAICNAKK